MAQYEGRVGINTDKPEQKLHVNGSMKANKVILDKSPYNGSVPKLGASEDYSFLLKSVVENRITTYNVQATGSNVFPAPFGVLTFNITTDPEDKDWVNEFDTKINADKYIAVLNYFNFNLPVVVDKSTNVKTTPIAQVFTYEKNGTWWIKADYHGFAPPTSTLDGLWEINLMIFDKSFAKSFSIPVNMNGAGTGQATNPLITN